MSVPIHGVKQN